MAVFSQYCKVNLVCAFFSWLGYLQHSHAFSLVSQPALTSTSSTSLSLTIYGHPGTRSPLVNWACYELDVDFEMGNLQENPHPFAQLPCITDDDGVLVFESGAILQYLNHKQQQQTTDSLTAAQFAAVTSWITWANASLDPICYLETPEGKVYDTGLRRPNAKIDRLNKLLSSNDKVLVPGAGFTLADVAVASYLLYVVQFFPDAAGFIATAWPHVHQYMKECASRDAYALAFGESTAARVVDLLSVNPPKKVLGMF